MPTLRMRCTSSSKPLLSTSSESCTRLTNVLVIDNVDTNPNISAQHRALVRTIMNDLNPSGEVQMYNPDVLAGVALMEQLGLIGPGRGAQIMSMTPPMA